MINAIILAGKSEKTLQGKENKGLLDINGKLMIQYVIDALMDSEVINKIVIVGDKKDFVDLENIEAIIEDRGSMIENLAAGTDYFRDDDRILVSTSDIPLLTGEGVRDFVQKGFETKADLCYPIINKLVSEEKYPNAKRTYAKLREGHFTGGNLILFNPDILDRAMNIARQLIEHRKNPMKMSRVLGFSFLIRFALGRLTIEGAEKKVGRILQIKPKAIISSYAEIGNDVDKPEDVEMVKEYLAI